MSPARAVSRRQCSRRPGLGRGLALAQQQQQLGQPSRLGGPKAASGENGAGSGGKTDFLRGAHATACRIFGTVLGPEANNAHKNHFHLDMAPRNRANFCE